MKTSQAVKKAGSKYALAAILGISRQAVGQWPDDVPRFQVDRLKLLKPEWFAKRKN
jgi:DNA-binding transcriptional regulator YdaS (Cro superfamily)